MKSTLALQKSILQLLLMMFLLVSCHPSRPRNPLTGRWEQSSGDTYISGWIEFSENGFMTMFDRDEYPQGATFTFPYSYTSDIVASGGEELLKYRFINDDLVVFTFGEDDFSTRQFLKILVGCSSSVPKH